MDMMPSDRAKIVVMGFPVSALRWTVTFTWLVPGKATSASGSITTGSATSRSASFEQAVFAARSRARASMRFPVWESTAEAPASAAASAAL